MESDHLLPIKVIAWTTLLIATISAFATPALSAPADTLAPAPFIACLQGAPTTAAMTDVEGSACRLIAPAVAISIGVSDGDAIISYYVPGEDGLKVDHSTSVAKDIDTAVAKGELSADDGAYIFAELLSSRDLGYKIPASESELKKAVGFSDNAQMSPDDQVEIIGSHLQMNLGVSAVTADYLVSKLGLQIIE